MVAQKYNIPYAYFSDERKKLYGIWKSMRNRCNNCRNNAYHNYGGRGIKVCKAWNQSFAKFQLDMGFKPDNLSLERINNDGPYSKENCIWADAKTQRNNQRKISKKRVI